MFILSTFKKGYMFETTFVFDKFLLTNKSMSSLKFLIIVGVRYWKMFIFKVYIYIFILKDKYLKYT